MYQFKYLLLSMCLLFIACSDDDDMQQEEMVESVDITGEILGSYTGLIRYTAGGSFFTEEDRSVTVTSLSDSTANMRISSIGGVYNMVVKLSSETDFTVEDAELYSEGPFSGEGSLSGDMLQFLVENGSTNVQYTGVR